MTDITRGRLSASVSTGSYGPQENYGCRLLYNLTLPILNSRPVIMPPPQGTVSDTVICTSVSLSQPIRYSTLSAWRSSLGYRHAGCLQWPATRYVRTADPSADGRRSAASRTAIGGGILSRRRRGDNLFI